MTRETEQQGWVFPENESQHFYVDCDFYFDKIDMDANNYFKVMLDGITESGRIWKDDNVAAERVQSIRYDTKRPRIEVYIHPVEYIGIFDNASQLERFVSRCSGCSRYTNNCSVLRRAKEGRVSEDIQDMICVKYKERKGKGKQNGK